MKIGFFGDSFCSDIQNQHSLENNYQTYIDKLSKKYSAKITNVGVGGSSIWDLVLLQFKPQSLPDVCIFVWTDPHRLFHRNQRNLTVGTLFDNHPLETQNKKLHQATKNYYSWLYDKEKHILEYQALLFYFDNQVLSNYTNKKFIHLWSFYDGCTYRWKNGVELRPSLETVADWGNDDFPNNDIRANHLEGDYKNQLICNSISDAIDNYETGKLLTFV
jgi:hypothetical protein